MKHSHRQRIGDLLFSRGVINKEQLYEVLSMQRLSGQRLGEIIVQMKYALEEDILEALSIQLGINRFSAETALIDKKAVLSIPENIAIKHNLIPISIEDNRIKVVMSDPLNVFAMDDVRIATGYEVESIIASKEDITNLIEKYYTNQSAQKAADELSRDLKNDKSVEEEANEDAFDEVKNAPAVRLVDSIIKAAIKNRASDIHIEPFEKYTKVRFRIDGELVESMQASKDVHGSVITRIKILGNMNIAERRVPQDGRILTQIDGIEVDLRVSTIPTIHGEKVVIRILRRDSFMFNKNDMGMHIEDLEKLERLMKNSYGIILVAGPTGSGKSTTLYSIISDLNTTNKNVVTVEDPVEYMMEGVNQISVNTKTGMTFAAGLRSILRQDPDIIMVGEIRDTETAEISIRAAITGHLVLSTVHTNDAPSTVSRLIDMEIEPFLVATSIVGIIAQRLVKRICNNCKEKYKALPAEMRILGMEGAKPIYLWRGKGCPICNDTGYLGRVGVYEIMEITKEHRQAILANKSTDELKALSIEQGMSTLRMSCTKTVLEGITTIDELARIAYLKE